MTKFEQLIEYVIQDEHAKAQELFHEIVVSKSREIYESLMDDECGGDASDDLIDDVETEESGLSLGEGEDEDEADAEFDDEAEEEGEDLTKDIEADHDEESEEGEEAEGDIEDRVVDLEDKLDELMAEFEELMGDDAGDDGEESFDDEVSVSDDGGDALEVDDTETFSDETGMPMSENIDLPKAPAPVTSEPEGTNKRSTTNANSGARGMQGSPVKSGGSESNPDGTSAYKAPTSYADKGRGDLPGAGQFKNVPGKDGSKLAAAPKATTAQAQGVNSRTPFPKG